MRKGRRIVTLGAGAAAAAVLAAAGIEALAAPATDGHDVVVNRATPGIEGIEAVSLAGTAPTSDFRISNMGFFGSAESDAVEADIAYNATVNEFLVVWSGDHSVNDENEIHVQRIDAATGAEVGTNDFRISDMGLDGNANHDALVPAVAWNSTTNEYLVVWHGDDGVNGEFEIYGQRLDATGAEVGTNDFRISNMGADGATQFDATRPDVAYDSTNDRFLVVWTADDTVDELFEIYGQLLVGATTAEFGSDDFRISTIGPAGNTSHGAEQAAVAYNAIDDEFLVAFTGDDNVSTENEIHAQRIDASTGGEVGTDDFAVSAMGPPGDVLFDGFSPALAWNSNDNEYLVVWHGDSGVNGENEIYGQRLLGATGAETGADDFRISNVGPDADPARDGIRPAVAYDSTDNRYLVAWSGDAWVDDENEIHGQRLDTSGTLLAPFGFRISELGPVGDPDHDGTRPAVAFGSTTDEHLVIWDGDDLFEGEGEIYGQAVGIPGDTNRDHLIDVADLLAILGDWGDCLGCVSDVTGDGVVSIDDLLLILGLWS